MNAENDILKVVLVEDDKALQLEIQKLMSHYPEFELVGFFSSTKEGVKFLNESHVDFVLLSIRFPDFDGYQLLYTANKTHPMFYSASNIMRVTSILDYSVIDFVRKPIKASRFEKAINRGLEKLKSENDDQRQDEECTQIMHFPIGKCMIPINLNHICFIESLGNYVKICGEKKVAIVSLSTQKVMDMLPSSQFMRVHRSFIVNENRVISCDNKEVTLCTRTVPVGISYRQSIREKLEIGE